MPAKPKVEEEQPKPAAIGKVNTSMFEQNIQQNSKPAPAKQPVPVKSEPVKTEIEVKKTEPPAIGKVNTSMFE